MKHIIVACSPGRSGSTSLYKNISEIFNKNNHTGKAYHHDIKDPRLLNNLYHSYKTKKDIKYLLKIRKVISKWKKGNCYVGASYSHILDEVLKIHKGNVKLIYLKRNQQDWLKSFVKEVKKFPWSHGNYSSKKIKKIEYKIAAFHYDEMTKKKWEKLSLKKKSIWFYKKYLDLFNINKNKSSKHIIVNTENLSSQKTTQKITTFLNSNWKSVKNTYRVNLSKIDFEDFNNKDKVILSRFYNNFDFLNFAKNPLEAEKYISNKIIDGFINKRIYEHSKINTKQFKNYLLNLKRTEKKVRKLLNEKK